MATDYDVIIIGTGAGGGTLAYRLAKTGNRILVLERGPFLPREKENWDTHEVFATSRYHNAEKWFTPGGEELKPGMSYFVGGNTKVYGAALFRLREKDFEAFQHKDGVSPAWPLKYADFEPYYAEAEALYEVHGQQGMDPTEPPRSSEYPHPPVSHEPRLQEVSQELSGLGLHPYYTPVGIKLNEAQRHLSRCIRCNTCDGYPCLVHAKSDAEVDGILPAISQSTVTLITEAKVTRLLTSADGRLVTAVEATINGQTEQFSGDLVVVACGSINSAVLLLKSASDLHPSGLANSSGLVGRNLMKHVVGSILGVTKKPNPTAFQKTMSINDFYWGEEGYDYPMGQIQTLGKVNKDMLAGAEEMFAPLDLEYVATHSVDWWLTTEDLPDSNNRVWVNGDKIILDYTENNSECYDRLEQRWTEILKSIDCGEHILPNCPYSTPDPGYFKSKLSTDAVCHQVGTCKFGDDPATSVLNLNCQTHDIDNLYVTDGSFFCSSGAVNPTLTIIANALRVGDHIKTRLGAA